jgi:hypothetical protein
MTPWGLQIEELAASLFGAHYKNRVMVMIAAYFDDSGTDEKDPAIVVGGCIATVDNWIKFQQEWDSILSHYSLPHFHMTDFDNRWGLFRRDKFAEENRIPLQSALLDAIKLRIQAIVVMATNKKEYDESIHSQYLKVYPFTVYECLSACEQWANEVGYDGPIAYMFDKGGGSKLVGTKGDLDKLKNDLSENSEIMRRFRMHDLESWSYGAVSKMPHLQSADIVAYEAWKDLTNNFFPSKQKRWRTSAGKLIMMERIYQGYFGQDEFVANYDKWLNKVRSAITE